MYGVKILKFRLQMDYIEERQGECTSLMAEQMCFDILKVYEWWKLDKMAENRKMDVVGES